eukprot:CAMPEP_0170513202 /NCGR_PEP_ID=MMETSP0208-20121228/67274_1 /TAXON_ID=197538 /ORGANISM="Strombidium inclinatum, Strain S3" /LENGTH=51 /DNA_ID=CAMNT_0010796913 /DNA_START=118 /DNA_END=273 /DNA_ORIENTATION=-
MNAKEFLKLVEEMYSYKFDPKNFNSKTNPLPPPKKKAPKQQEPQTSEFKSL